MPVKAKVYGLGVRKDIRVLNWSPVWSVKPVEKEASISLLQFVKLICLIDRVSGETDESHTAESGPCVFASYPFHYYDH